MVDQAANTVRSILDAITRSNGFGTRTTSIADLLSFFNHRGVGVAMPIRAESTGMVFFTRPNMNLSYDNLAADRILTPLLTENPLTYQRVIRNMLDPVGGGLSLPGLAGTEPGRDIHTPLFDNSCAFMPILTNNLLSLSGWPDIALDTYTSHEGVLRENWSMVDGTSKNYQSFDLQASFRNIGGDPITLLLMVWATYMDHVHRGVMTPYMISVVTNRIDYYSRIFRFTLDPSRTRIQKWCSGIGVFPTGVPIGAEMNFTAENPYVHDNMEEISLGFRVHGAEYMDPIIFNEFNETVEMFNPSMDDDLREIVYTKIPYDLLKLFNWRGYPHINVLTNELEWWVENEVYAQRTSVHKNLYSLQSGPIAPSSNSAPLMAEEARPPEPSNRDPMTAGWGNFMVDIAGNIIVDDGSDNTSSTS